MKNKIYSILAGMFIVSLVLLAIVVSLSTIAKWINPAAFFPVQGTASLIDPAKSGPISICLKDDTLTVTTSNPSHAELLRASSNQSVFIESGNKTDQFKLYRSDDSNSYFVLRAIKFIAQENNTYIIWALSPAPAPIYMEANNSCLLIDKN